MAVDRLLDGVDPYYSPDAGPVFPTERLPELRAAADELAAAVRDGRSSPARRFAAVLALLESGASEALREEQTSRAAAEALAAAIPRDRVHNRWGLPHAFVGPLGQALLALPAGAGEALTPLLEDDTELRIDGGEAATVQQHERYRVADLAAYLLAQLPK